MSDIAMAAPEESQELKFSKLVICLPPNWPVTDDAWKADENYWPVRALKFLARFAHEYQTWLWATHTILNGNPPEPFAPNTLMDGAILLPPVTLAEDFYQLKIDEEKMIHFHSVVPRHWGEMELKLQKGTDALFDGFEKAGVSELPNPARASSLSGKKKKRGWFPFPRN